MTKEWIRPWWIILCHPQLLPTHLSLIISFCWGCLVLFWRVKKTLPGAYQHVFHVLPSALFLTCRLNVNGFDNVTLRPKKTKYDSKCRLCICLRLVLPVCVYTCTHFASEVNSQYCYIFAPNLLSHNIMRTSTVSHQGYHLSFTVIIWHLHINVLLLSLLFIFISLTDTWQQLLQSELIVLSWENVCLL